MLVVVPGNPSPRDRTEELQISDLERARPAPPPLPRAATPPPPPPEPAAPPPRARRHSTGAYTHKPTRRIVRAYTATLKVVGSYVWLGFMRRFRARELHEQRLEEAHRRNARRIEAAIVELGGLFIKVGQLISIMANFLPEAFRRELQGLQDQVPPRPYEDIEARIREEFGGRGPTEVFASFEREPVASASIGQVHVARLPTGEKVAVKVQYPDIEAIVRTDLTALRRIFWVVRRMLPDWGFDTIYREIREMVLAELDYRLEAESLAAIAANFADRKDVVLPKVIRATSTSRVLTTEWMEGVKVADAVRLESAGIDKKRAARSFVEAYCQQIFVDGLYHADPHPGNLLVRKAAGPGEEQAVIFLDFGATARVSEAMRRGMLSFIQGAITRDSSRIIAAMKEMGFISRRADPAVFDRVVEYFHEKFRADIRLDGFMLKDIRFEPRDKLDALLHLEEMNVSLADLRDAFHVPKEWVLLERALLLLLGVCTTLDPEMNPTTVIVPYLERFLLGGKKDFSETAVEATREAALSALALPSDLRRFMTAAERGQLGVVIRNFDEGVRLVYDVGQQLLWGLIGIAATALAVVFDGRGQATARGWATAAAVMSGLFLGVALLRGRLHRRPRR